ncbi:MAG: 16S rRNA (guanine(966)-N(2))-methyltransferase RsmD [bacterium]
MRSKKRSNKSKQGSHSLRIIAGEWRSRKLPILDAQGLRPTPDRVRETLFNWLQHSVRHTHCLDLFAGSGALGFEALSRGADSLIFVEKNKAVAKQLLENCNTLKTTQAEVINADAIDFISSYASKEQAKFDLLFLDPPYRKGLITSSLNQLIENHLIDSNALIYVEYEAEENFDWSDFDLLLEKETVAGQVKCCLLKFAKN